MPSTNKRINLTVPDEIYARIKEYELQHGLYSDATACLQLIVQQLDSLEKSSAIMNFIQQSSLEQLNQITKEGLGFVKSEMDKALPPDTADKGSS